MSFPSLLADSVARVSGGSVLLSLGGRDALDLGTLSAAPPSHRAVLQANGLVAKAILCVSPPSSGLTESQRVELFSADSRRAIWMHSLRRAGLVPEGSKLAVPPVFDRLLWPLLTESQFDERVMYYSHRKHSTDCSSSAHCVPILYLKQVFVKEETYTASLCVIWMPFFVSNLASWCTRQLRPANESATDDDDGQSSKPISEAAILKVAQHANYGLSAVRKMLCADNCSRVVQDTTLTNFEMDNILVNDTDEEPVFVLSASTFHKSAVLETVQGEDATANGGVHPRLSAFPFLAPEQALAPDIATRPKYDVWSLGMTLLILASGKASAHDFVKSLPKRLRHQPLNHPLQTPQGITDFVADAVLSRGYTGCLMSAISLLLSPDPLTRPSVSVVEAMLADLCKTTPVLRFPFAIGSFQLLRIAAPDKIQLNPGARKYISSDDCCYCKKPRNLTSCKDFDHAPALTSPSWSTPELLPGIARPDEHTSVAFLYPAIPEQVDERERRRLLLAALQGTNGSGGNGDSKCDLATLNPDAIFQLTGGFCIYEKKATAGQADKPTIKVREVLVPVPRYSLRAAEESLAEHQLDFGAALPWPSECTEYLIRKKRVTRQVPTALAGRAKDVQGFAWLLPGECFRLGKNPNKFVVGPGGGFVFFFDENLGPSGKDRYFPLTVSTTHPAVTPREAVPRTALPDTIFRAHVGEELRRSSSVYPIQQHPSDATRLSQAMRRRSSQVIDAPEIPKSNGIVEREDTTMLESSRSGLLGNLSTNHSHLYGAGNSSSGNGRRQRHTSAGRRRSAAPSATAINYPSSSDIENTPVSSKKSYSLCEGGTSGAKKCVAEKNYPSPLRAAPHHLQGQHQQAAPVDGAPSAEQFLPATQNPSDQALKHLSLSKGLSTASLFGSPLSPCASSASGAMLRLFGRWRSASLIDAPFGALTFWVPGTVEHGSLQSPVLLSDGLRAALHAPSDATHVAFLSNPLPLLARDHPRELQRLLGPQTPSSGDSLLFPHHGFVLYGARERVIGAVSLRCGAHPREAPNTLYQEFWINLRPATPVLPTAEAQSYYTPSYVSPVTAAESPFANQPIVSELNSPRTPREEEHQNGHPSPLESKRVSWIGFDQQRCFLVAAPALGSQWFPHELIAPSA